MDCLIIYVCFILAIVEIRECQLQHKIVGGKPVHIERFPYQISLRYYNKHHCGGSIISKEWILTAAHCVHARSRQYFLVRAGSTLHKRQGTLHNITMIIAHKDYNVSNNDYDIALLRVKPHLRIGTRRINNIKLATREPPEGVGTIVSGWGTYIIDGMLKQKPDELRAVRVEIVKRAKCRRLMKRLAVTDRMICAGDPLGGKDACQGDSGGPLATTDTLVGVVSWGVGCGKPKYPGVYANVASLRKWIEQSSGV